MHGLKGQRVLTIGPDPGSHTVGAPAESLPVVETFHSLQGEGVHTGRSAFFLRLGGCEVGCPWCDTKHSWPEAVHPHRPLADLAQEAAAARIAGAAFVVITGGEPLQHNLDALCARLRQPSPSADRPLPLHLETSGVHQLSGRFDWITLSPKRHRPPTAELLAVCDELKVVVHEPADLAFAEAMATVALEGRRSPWSEPAGSGTAEPALLLQPGWDSAEGRQRAIDFVRARPAWRLSLQTHKWLGVR